MAEQQDLEEVEEDLDESDEALLGATKARSPASKAHLAKVETEYQALRSTDAKLLQMLR